MADKDKIIIIPGSQVDEVKDPAGKTFLGYMNVGGKLKTIRIAFEDMTPLFGVSQEKGQSITLVPSQKLFTDEVDKKANSQHASNSEVAYSNNGRLPTLMLPDELQKAVNTSIQETNIATIEGSYVNTSGVITADANWHRTGYLSVKDYINKPFSTSIIGGSSVSLLSFYDEAGNWIISPILGNQGTTTSQYLYRYISQYAPKNAATFIISTNKVKPITFVDSVEIERLVSENSMKIVSSGTSALPISRIANSYIGQDGGVKSLSSWNISLYDISNVSDTFMYGLIRSAGTMAYGFYNSTELSASTLVQAGDWITNNVDFTKISKVVPKPSGATILAISELSTVDYVKYYSRYILKDVRDAVSDLLLDIQNNPYARQSELVIDTQGDIIPSSSVIASSHINLNGDATTIAASWQTSLYAVLGLSDVYLKGKIRSGGSLAWAFYSSDIISSANLIQKGDRITDNVNYTEIDKSVKVPDGAKFIGIPQLVAVDYTKAYESSSQTLKEVTESNTKDIQNNENEIVALNNKLTVFTSSLMSESSKIANSYLKQDGSVNPFFYPWEVALYDISDEDAIWLNGLIKSGGTMAYGFYNSTELSASTLVQAGDWITNNTTPTTIDKIVSKPLGAIILAVSRNLSLDYIKVYNNLKYEEIADVVTQNTEEIAKLKQGSTSIVFVQSWGDSITMADKWQIEFAKVLGIPKSNIKNCGLSGDYSQHVRNRFVEYYTKEVPYKGIATYTVPSLAERQKELQTNFFTFWVGTNNLIRPNRSNGSVTTGNADWNALNLNPDFKYDRMYARAYVDQVLNDLRIMINMLPHNNFVIMSGHGAYMTDMGLRQNMLELDEMLGRIYPHNFINVREQSILNYDYLNTFLAADFVKPVQNAQVTITLTDASWVGDSIKNGGKYICIGTKEIYDKYYVEAINGNELTVKLIETKSEWVTGDVMRKEYPLVSDEGKDAVTLPTQVFSYEDVVTYTLRSYPRSMMDSSNVHPSDSGYALVGRLIGNEVLKGF